jgi:hypothetical protein
MPTHADEQAGGGGGGAKAKPTPKLVELPAVQKRVLILEHDKGTPLSVLADKFNISRRTATRINKERAKWMSVDAGTGKRDKHVLREDVDDVVDDLLAEEGDDDQSDDEAAAAAGPTNSETFATLSEKARAAGQAALAAQHSSWTAATRQYVLDAAAPFLFLMEHSPAPPQAVQLMQRLKAVLLKPTQKRKQTALHSFFSKVNRREALVAAARASGGDGAGGDGGDGDSEGGGGGDADAESGDEGSCVEEVGEESAGVEE